MQCCSVAGWAAEWRVTYRAGERPRKAALIQLCYRLTSGEACCLLAQVWHSGITPALLELLESEVGSDVACRPAGSTPSALCGDLLLVSYLCLWCGRA